MNEMVIMALHGSLYCMTQTQTDRRDRRSFFFSLKLIAIELDDDVNSFVRNDEIKLFEQLRTL